MTSDVVVVENLRKTYRSKSRLAGGHDLDAVKNVSFRLERGKTLGIVGETGAGKSTVGRLVLRLVEPTSGKIEMFGEDLGSMKRSDLRRFRRRAQMIFQD